MLMGRRALGKRREERREERRAPMPPARLSRRDDEEKGHGDAGSPILGIKSRFPGVSRTAFSVFRVPHLRGPGWLYATLARLSPWRGGPVVLPDGRVTRRLTSSAPAGFAAGGCR
jgi:hypothetical protein